MNSRGFLWITLGRTYGYTLLLVEPSSDVHIGASSVWGVHLSSPELLRQPLHETRVVPMRSVLIPLSTVRVERGGVELSVVDDGTAIVSRMIDSVTVYFTLTGGNPRGGGHGIHYHVISYPANTGYYKIT